MIVAKETVRLAVMDNVSKLLQRSVPLVVERASGTLDGNDRGGKPGEVELVAGGIVESSVDIDDLVAVVGEFHGVRSNVKRQDERVGST